MTATAEPTVEDRSGAAPTELSGRPIAALVEGGAAAVALAVFAFHVMPGAGGRDTSQLAVALLTATACFVATRAWRRLSMVTVGAMTAVCVAAFAVCQVAPTAGAGLRTASFYVLGALTFGVVAAFCRTPARRAATAVAAGLLGVLQFSQALLPWLAGGDPDRLMIGTFYWHNQFGAYLLGTGLVAGVTAVFGERTWRRPAAIIAPLCAAGVLLSGSRGSILVLSTGWLVVAAAAALQRAGRRPALLRWLLVTGLSAVALSGLTSGLLMPTGGSATGALQSRTESSDGSLRYRIVTDQAAVAVILEHPWVGAGFDSFAQAGSPHLPVGFTRSPYVHNGYLQVAEEGGLLLATPFLVALALAVRAVWSRLRRSWRTATDDWPRTAAAVGAGGLLVHAAVDMDWSYPGLVVLTALLLALAAGDGPARHTTPASARARGVAVLAAVLTLAGLGAAAGIVRWEKIRQPARWPVAAADWLAEDRSLFTDPRPDVAVINAAVPRHFVGSIQLPHAVVAASLERTGRVAAVDGALQLMRAQAYVALGRADVGVRLAASVVDAQGGNRPHLVGEYAELLAAVGRRDEGISLVTSALTRNQRGPAALQWGLVETLVRLDPSLDDEGARCAAAFVAATVERPRGGTDLAVPTARDGCPAAVPD